LQFRQVPDRRRDLSGEGVGSEAEVSEGFEAVHVGRDRSGQVVLRQVEVLEVGAFVQGCRKLAGNGVVGEVKHEEVFEIADCGREALGGGDAFAGEEKFRDGAVAAAANLRPVARRRWRRFP